MTHESYLLSALAAVLGLLQLMCVGLVTSLRSDISKLFGLQAAADRRLTALIVRMSLCKHCPHPTSEEEVGP